MLRILKYSFLIGDKNMGGIPGEIAAMTGLIGMLGGMVLGFGMASSGPDKSDIGISFKTPAEANLRREFGLLSKETLDQAVAKAVDQYMADGTKKPVIVELPPRPVAKTSAPAAP
jgi:hypothetical protein